MDNEKYTLDFDHTQGFILANTSINRVGSDAVWGKINLGNNLEQFAKTISDRLSLIEDTNRVPVEGDYGIFRYSGGKAFFDDQDLNDYTFFIHYEDWEATKEELIQLLTEINPNTYYISNSYGITL